MGTSVVLLVVDDWLVVEEDLLEVETVEDWVLLGRLDVDVDEVVEDFIDDGVVEEDVVEETVEEVFKVEIPDVVNDLEDVVVALII